MYTQGFFLIGLLFLSFSVLFLFAPKLIVKLSEIANKLIFTDHSTVAHRRWTGFILIVVSVVMFYLGIKL